jgi:hypothetical protein
MENQKGSVSVWITVILVIGTIVGVAYWGGQSLFYNHSPQILKEIDCGSNLKWRLVSQNVAEKDPEMGTPWTAVTVILSLFKENSLVFSTPSGLWPSSEGNDYITTSGQRTAYHDAIGYLFYGPQGYTNFVQGTSTQSVVAQNEKQTALDCLYSNFPSDTIGTPQNFPKSVSLQVTPGLFTLIPGQAATGTLDDKAVALKVDSTSPYRSHMFVDGIEVSENQTVTIGTVTFDPSGSNGDHSYTWQVTVSTP